MIDMRGKQQVEANLNALFRIWWFALTMWSLACIAFDLDVWVWLATLVTFFIGLMHRHIMFAIWLGWTKKRWKGMPPRR